MLGNPPCHCPKGEVHCPKGEVDCPKGEVHCLEAKNSSNLNNFGSFFEPIPVIDPPLLLKKEPFTILHLPFFAISPQKSPPLMQNKNGGLLLSPSDLIRFMESSFASWMELHHLVDPAFASRDPLTEDAKLIAKIGDQHEARFLQKLIDEGRDIVFISKSNMDTALAETRQAIADGREVIYQGALAMKHFAGYTDFIVRGENGDYEIWDTKLARQAKPYHLVQLCCYAEMLEPLVGYLPKTIRVVLGDLRVVPYRTADFFHSYLRIKQKFNLQIHAFGVDCPKPLPDPRANHRHWTSHAEAWLLERDHLVQVAGINTRQMDKLVAAGIDTMQKLADSTLTSIPKLKAEGFAKIQAQARIQVKARSLTEGGPPPFEILHPVASTPRTGLALLPPESPGDVYFDIEGYPLENDGLEYLLGVTHLVGGKPEFKDWWAHNDAEEKQSFEAFIDWIMARWQQHPDMHVYHYAPYEVTAIKRLVGKIDRVLVDAPCTGMGTLRRNPDLKWRQTPEAVAELTVKQSAILASAARLLKPGGRLIYATCSLLRAENEDIADAFCAEHSREFKRVPAEQVLGDAHVEQAASLVQGPNLRLWPHKHGTDGFFAAVWQRI